MKSLFDDITDDEYETLENVLRFPNRTPADFFFDDPTIDGRIEELVRAKLINISNGKVNITELGRAALKEHVKSIQKSKRNKFVEIIKFVIPTLISLAALIVSVIALLQTTPTG